MTITIKAGNANNDGKGINVLSYLNDYAKTFVKSGYGAFSGDNFAGEEYSLNDGKDGGQGVVFKAGSTDWAYDMVTHTVTGSIDTVKFGSHIALDGDKDVFDLDLDLSISGLEINDSSGANTFLAELGDSSIDGLMAMLESSSILFRGSSGRDVFAAFEQADRLLGGGGKDVLSGGGDNDRLNGGAGGDRLNGGGGNDKMTGGSGIDHFIFKESFGDDTVGDFKVKGRAHDVIVFAKSDFDNFADVKAAAKETNQGVLIEHGANSVLLENVSLSDLTRSHFDFG